MLTSILLTLGQWLVLPFIFGTWTTPRTWVAGELVTAAMMNTHVRDNLNSLRSEHFGVQRFRGLHLRTKLGETAKVSLVLADEIVMDDGTRLGGWAEQEASTGVSGAGGLDTGSLVASTWYEIYAIAKDDGTKNLLLHRAKDYFLDEQQTTENNSHALRFDSSTERLAQGFQTTESGKLEFVDLALLKTSAPTGDIWVTIEADSSGSPSGTALATSVLLQPSAMATASQYHRFVFHTPATITAGTTYHIVLRGNYTTSSTNYMNWRKNTAAGYANGTLKTYNGSAWADTTHDAAFKVYITRNDTAVTMPTGYTKKALIGFVYSNASSNLVQFIQQDNHVHTVATTYATTSTVTIATLFDLFSLVPPRPVRLYCVGNISVAGDRWSFFGVPNETGTAWNISAGAPALDPSGIAQVLFLPIPTEKQGVYAYRNSGTGNASLFVFAYDW